VAELDATARNLQATATDQAAAQVPEDIGMYLDKLRRDHPAVDQIWLLGRQPQPVTGSVVWELLLFADNVSLTAIRADATLPRMDVKLVVVTDGDAFESVWGDPAPGRLTRSGWYLETSSSARFDAPLAHGSTGAGTDSANASRVR
jgi:hypothetical protein